MGRVRMIDFLFLQLLVAVGFLLAAGLASALLRLVPGAVPADPGTFLILALPLVALLLAEGATGLWLRTPGTLGLGSLNVIVPALAAGALAAVINAAAHKILVPLDPEFPRESEGFTIWIALAVIATTAALALWRYWPEPRPRLF